MRARNFVCVASATGIQEGGSKRAWFRKTWQILFESATRLWVVHISNKARLAAWAQREGFLYISCTRMGDLSKYDTREKMKAAMEKT